MNRKTFLRYDLETSDGRIYKTRIPYTMFLKNKIVKITRVTLSMFKKVIYDVREKQV